MLVGPPMTNFKMTVRGDRAVSACRPLCLQKLLPPDCPQGGWGESAFGQASALPPLPQLPASKIKQTFLSTNLASLLAFVQQAAAPHFRLHDLAVPGRE